MKIIPLTSIKSIDLAGPNQPLCQARAMLASLGVDPNRLRSLYRIRFAISATYQKEYDIRKMSRDDLLLAITEDHTGFFFISQANGKILPAMIIDKNEVVQTLRFQCSSFICRPDEQSFINRLRTLL